MAGAQWFGAASFGVTIAFLSLFLKDVNSNASELARASSSDGSVLTAPHPGQALPVAWVVMQQKSHWKTGSQTHGNDLNGLPVALHMGQEIQVQKGGVLRALIFPQATVREYEGPANLKVIKDTISLVSGQPAKVYPATEKHVELAKSWVSQHANQFQTIQVQGKSGATDGSSFNTIYPIDNSVLLTRRPEFVFSGVPPKDGTLIIYRPDGRRHWVQPIEVNRITFPPAAEFEWGQKFTWEVRKRTGGRLLQGSFSIATEQQAFDLMSAKVPSLPDTPPEDLLFYALQLHMAGAYREAQAVMGNLQKLGLR